MIQTFRSRPMILLVGDICAFVFALWASLFLRTFLPPTQVIFLDHLAPFSLLFIVWVIVFTIAGLYESRSIILARRVLSGTLLVAQSVNIVIAALFFFFIPLFGIAPKTLLIIYLIVSLICTLLWRVILFPRLGLQRVENAIVIGGGEEIEELAEALKRAPRAPTRVIAVIHPETDSIAEVVEKTISEQCVRFVIADFTDPRISSAFPQLYNFISKGIRFFDALSLYEQVFGRVPLSVIDDRWLARNVSKYSHLLYDSAKRIMDIVVASAGGVISLFFYPFIILAIKLDDGGPIFVSLDRVGEDNKVVKMYKFRSMSGNDNAQYGHSGTTKLKVTRVGKYIRRLHVDEFPQFWNIVRGDLSLVGPRPEAPSLVAKYEKEIPYYGVRHLIKPGLFGWAQLNHHADPHGAVDVEETSMKLSHDLYYLKHRSLGLDLLIALKTIRRLLVTSNA